MEGDPGTGKTTLGLQFLLEGVRRGERTLYITLTETADELRAVAESHGWSLDGVSLCEIRPNGASDTPEADYTILHPGELELGEITRTISEEVKRVSPARVVLDSVTEIRLLARDGLRHRRQVLYLKRLFDELHCTVIVLDDQSAQHGDLQLQSISHGALRLEHRADDYGIGQRRLRVLKLRGVAYREGFMPSAIDVVVERHGKEVAVRIRDTGVGIAPEMLPRVWDLFVQADRTLDRAQGGLGIGLTIARRLVELHGARIEAHSSGLGQGAEFTVTLRALPMLEESRPARRPESIPQRTARVLVVEDNADTADSVMMLLELLGHRVRVAHDGVAALDAARANVPDVMLVDIGLPGVDGYEVARRVRRDPDLKHVVLVALTGYGQEEDKRQAMEAGYDYHLVKPVDPDALHGLVARLGKDEPERPPTVH